MAASPDGSVRKASWRSASAAWTLTRIARYSPSSGRLAEVACEQYGEPVRQAPVGVVRRVPGRERWPEIDEREAGDAPLHRQVLVEHRVDGGPPVGGGEVREPGRDAVGVGVQVAQGEGVDERALVGEEPVDGADGHLGALRDGPGGELLVSGLVEEAWLQESSIRASRSALRCCTGARRRFGLTWGTGPMMPCPLRRVDGSGCPADGGGARHQESPISPYPPRRARHGPRMARCMPLTCPALIPTVVHRIHRPADPMAFLGNGSAG